MTGSIHTEEYQDLIGLLIEARIDAGLTQQELADSLGKPQSYIAKVEGCERRLDIIEFLHIAKAIGANPIPVIKEVSSRI